MKFENHIIEKDENKFTELNKIPVEIQKLI